MLYVVRDCFLGYCHHTPPRNIIPRFQVSVLVTYLLKRPRVHISEVHDVRESFPVCVPLSMSQA